LAMIAELQSIAVSVRLYFFLRTEPNDPFLKGFL